MIQNGTYLNVVDNSGGKIVCCIKILKNYKRRYAYLGDVVLVSVKSLRAKRKATSKIKKGEMYFALIVRAKTNFKNFSQDSVCFQENSVVLLTKQHKLVGTRLFGSVLKFFRFTKYLKILSVSAGISSC